MSSVSFSETKIGRHSKQPWQGSNSGRRKALSCLPRISVMASRELNFALHSGWQAQRSVRLSYSRLALLAYKNVNSVGIQEKKSFRCKFLIHTVLNQQLQVSFHYGIQLLQISFNTPSHKCFPPPPAILTDRVALFISWPKGPCFARNSQEKTSHDMPHICISLPKCLIFPVNSWVNAGAPKTSAAIFLSYLCQRTTDLFLEGFCFLNSLVCCYSGASMWHNIHSYHFSFIHIVPPKIQISRPGLLTLRKFCCEFGLTHQTASTKINRFSSSLE